MKEEHTNGRRIVRETSLAQAYVPMQTAGDVFNAAEALRRGTIFPELDMPYMGRVYANEASENGGGRR